MSSQNSFPNGAPHRRGALGSAPLKTPVRLASPPASVLPDVSASDPSSTVSTSNRSGLQQFRASQVRYPRGKVITFRSHA